MKQYKKRTIALILASCITVAGAFGAEKYKNSLMSLKFESNSNGAVDMTLFTKINYASPINAIKKDESTYVIMLPETNCEKDIPKEISGSVNSVDIRTMPYTTSSNGYTKITVKTIPNTPLITKKAIYIPTQKPLEQIAEKSNNEVSAISNSNTYSVSTDVSPNKQESTSFQKETKQNDIEYHPNNSDNPANIERTKKEFEPSPSQVQESKNKVNNITSDKQQEDADSSEKILYLLGLLFVITSVIYFYIKGKNKMAEILGEQADFDVDDKEEEKKKKSKVQKIKATINNIDKMYQKPTTLKKGILSNNLPETKQVQEDYTEESNVVDLDELFQEKTKTSVLL